MTEFIPFPKIPRLNREIIITEKIDGTNGCIVIGEDMLVRAQSRNRFITADNDNRGFARWVRDHTDQLVCTLGIGRHFGEWWGPGIQRGYGLREKRFSLFNVHKWKDLRPTEWGLSVVPTLYTGPWFLNAEMRGDLPATEVWAPNYVLAMLRLNGSVASPGFMRPEGIVVYHTAGGVMFKATLEGDEGHKRYSQVNTQPKEESRG